MHRRALGVLFAVLAAGLGLVAVISALEGGSAPIAFAAGRPRALAGRLRPTRVAQGLRSPCAGGVFSCRGCSPRTTRRRSGRSTASVRWDQGLRDRLILTYAPSREVLVAGRVGASLPAHVDEHDLASYGLLGLIGAIERYDPGREIKFETFAMARIPRRITDEFRLLDWVPRSV